MSSPSGKPSPAPAISNSARPRVPPRVVNTSPKDRIDSILEEARARKVAMDASSYSSTASPGGGVRILRGGLEGVGETESSADEETSIVRRPSKQSMNYQATHRTPARSQSSITTARSSEQTHRSVEHEDDETAVDEHESWWARLLSEYGSIELENKGSVARDHLALERTFLAWLRTSLAFASIGIAITQLFRLNTASASTGGSDPYLHLRQMGKPLGATFLAISIVMLFVGFHRYFESQHWIIRGKFPASRGSIAVVAAITFALMITSLVVVVVVEPTAFEKR